MIKKNKKDMVVQSIDLHIVEDIQKNMWRVSTINLDNAYNFDPLGSIAAFADALGKKDNLKYETMVFPEGSSRDVYCERYKTKKRAQKRHLEICKELEGGKLALNSRTYLNPVLNKQENK